MERIYCYEGGSAVQKHSLLQKLATVETYVETVAACGCCWETNDSGSV